MPHLAVPKVTLRPRRPITSRASAHIILGIEVGLLALSSWRSAVYEDTLLTDIECKVLDCAAEGMTVDQTAGLRGVSRGTIMTQRRSVLRKIGARNMAEAVARGYELGLLGRP